MSARAGTMTVAAAALTGLALFGIAWALGTGLLGALFAGWTIVLALPVGATTLLLIHALTGGRWGAALRPALAPAAAATPVAALCALPFLVLPSAVYPDFAASGIDQGVRDLYLNDPGVGLRGTAVLVVWSAAGLYAALVPAPGRLVPALLLVAHAVAVSIAGFDWLMAQDPTWSSTVIGAQLGAGQIVLALAWCAVVPLELAPGEREDLAKLLLACTLGVAYLAFSAFLVHWSGNLPHDASWYLVRVAPAWAATAALAVVAGLLLPLALLLTRRGRGDSSRLRFVGLGALLGNAALLLWLIGPTAPLAAQVFGLLGWACLWLAGIAAWRTRAAPAGRPNHG